MNPKKLQQLASILHSLYRVAYTGAMLYYVVRKRKSQPPRPLR